MKKKTYSVLLIFCNCNSAKRQANVEIPLVTYYTAVSGHPFYDRGVVPDYKVEPTVNHILSGEDPVLNFCTKLIQNN